MRRLVFDLDNTITVPDAGRSYQDKVPCVEFVQKMREYKQAGFEIIIHTSRNMNTHSNSIGKINARTLPIILEWLDRHHIPYDEIHVGKPWCGEDGFYVDDRAIRPAEFLNMSFEEIQELLAGAHIN